MKENMTLDQQVLRHGRRQKRFLIMSITGGVFLVLLLYLTFSPGVDALLSLLAILLLILLVTPYTVICLILFIMAKYSSWKLQGVLKSDMIPRLLRDILGECTYDPKGRIPDDLIVATSAMPSDMMDIIQGNDLVTGMYKGMAYAMCDITSYHTSRSSDGKANHTQQFRGRWMILKTGLHPDGPVCVLERSADDEFTPANPVITESIAFNERFQLAGDPLTVFKLITPPMMEKLLEAEKVDSGAVTRVKYLPNGTVGISLYTGRDAMEIGYRSFRSEEELRKHMESEIRLMLNVIDALELKGENP